MLVKIIVAICAFTLASSNVVLADTTVDGRYVLAAHAAESYLRGTKMPAKLQNLSNYDLMFYETLGIIHIEFVPHKIKSDRGLFGCTYNLGRAMAFGISKKDYKVVQFRSCI